MYHYIVSTLVLLSMYALPVQATYQLSTDDQMIVNNFVGHVQAISASKPAEVSNKITDIMSRSRLTPRPFAILSQIQNQLKDGMQTQTWVNTNLNINLTIPKTWMIDDDDTAYGAVFYGPMHEQVPGFKSISIYQIHARSDDQNLNQHVASTHQQNMYHYDTYTYSGAYDTNIKGVPAKGYRRQGQEKDNHAPHQGSQIVSLSGSKGITATYSTTHDQYDAFGDIWNNIAQQIKSSS